MHIERTYLRFLFMGEHHLRTLDEGPDEEKMRWRMQALRLRIRHIIVTS